MQRVFALVDCNSFYASCEAVFEPGLAGKPVVVLSNNDGCVVARNAEAKRLEIGIGGAAFEIGELIRRHDIRVYSSNYPLYGDMSRRVMKTLGELTPALEVYSIDEAFCDLSGTGADLSGYGRKIRETVERWTGITVSVGIAPSKTLAKLANRQAKAADGVALLMDRQQIEAALAETGIGEIWGIGRRHLRSSLRRGIRNALQFRDTDSRIIDKWMGLVGLRLQEELRGVCCYPLEHSGAPRQGIGCSRTFRREIGDLATMREAVSSFISRVAEKLRSQRSAAMEMWIRIETNRFRERPYAGSRRVRFRQATNDTREMIRAGLDAMESIYHWNRRYKRAGVWLTKIIPEHSIQGDLFLDDDIKRRRRAMRALDEINTKYGIGTVSYLSSGLIKLSNWRTTFNCLSPARTTRWDQLLSVRC
ncbi:MAG: Y-family DNA polymerase [Candidatus Glassbacteria bacterium]|nr:Y-family DNA polymerase [Candidatus Glassbacteria bacterium]